MTDRKVYLEYLYKTAGPVLEAPCLRDVKIEQKADRSRCTWMEAVGRLICGIAPWLESASADEQEETQKQRYRILCRGLITRQFDPDSKDYIHFTKDEPQFLVDLAFLAEGMLRAPHELIDLLDPDILKSITDVMIRSRAIRPYESNWLLFSAMVEALIFKLTGSYEKEPVQYAFDRLESWYKGDGVYGDGPELAWDYYNSYVIYPMLMELHDIFPELSDKEQKDRLLLRAKRYAALQEKMIAPDGTFIVTGRSIAYRCGAFHHLANMALREELPQELSPGAVRCALGEVIQRTLGPASFREDGFLTIGVCGSQPSLGEPYISTGSLYLCLTAFLPLGLSPDAPFWTEADQDWTQRRLWKGQDMARDISYHE